MVLVERLGRLLLVPGLRVDWCRVLRHVALRRVALLRMAAKAIVVVALVGSAIVALVAVEGLVAHGLHHALRGGRALANVLLSILRRARLLALTVRVRALLGSAGLLLALLLVAALMERLVLHATKVGLLLVGLRVLLLLRLHLLVALRVLGIGQARLLLLLLHVRLCAGRAKGRREVGIVVCCVHRVAGGLRLRLAALLAQLALLLLLLCLLL